MARKFLFIALLMGSIPAVRQIVTPGYFPIHDDTQVVRVYEMFQALRSGQFPVRWVPDLGYGYGYPIFNFYNPLPYYVGGISMFGGLDALGATKLMMALGVILAGISMFVLARSALKGSDLSERSDPSWGAIIAAILYVYAPYHGVQIYVRGAVAEYWAYAVLPFVFYGLWKRKVILTGISLAVLITSHNLTAFMSIPLLVLLSLLQCFKTLKSSQRAYSLVPFLLSLILALGLSAFFWLPAIVESSKTRLSEMVFAEFDQPAEHLITFNQLWTSPWGYGGSSPETDDGLSFQLGKVHLLGSLAAIAILLYCYIAKRKKIQLTIEQFSNLTIFPVVGLAFSLFMTLPFSQSIWGSFPLLAYIQFPWRFLTFASLFASILTAQFLTLSINFITSHLPKRQQMTHLLFLVSCSWFVAYSLKFFQPQFKFPTTAAQLTNRERIVWEVSKRSDEYLPLGFVRPQSLEEALRGKSRYNQELIEEMKQPTLIRTAGNLLSLISLISLIFYGIYRRAGTA